MHNSSTVLRDAAMEYHRHPKAGKISIAPTKSLVNQDDLSLAYSPGVAYPCLGFRSPRRNKRPCVRTGP